MIEFSAACGRTATILTSLNDDGRTAPTPCAGLTVGEVVTHVGGLALAFAAAARKDFGPLTDAPPFGDTTLDSDWCATYPDRLAVLAEDWRRADARQGMTRVAGMDLPGDTAGVIALTERADADDQHRPQQSC